jgi:hypothetical protein
MIKRNAILHTLAIAALAAQTMPVQTPSNGAPAVNAGISGVVKDKGTGAPLKDYTVSTYVNATWANGGISMGPATKQVTSTTDEQGQYRLKDLPPAQYHVQARSAQGFAGGQTRIVTVAGHDLENIDFSIVVTGSITGKVIDENKEPMPGMTVFLVSKEYYLGTIGYFLKGSARTDDRGEYTMPRVEAGHPYLLLAELRPQKLPAHSDAPLNQKMRKRVPLRTWYPSAPSKDGAAPIILRPGERRDAIDIEVKKSPAYCVSGIASTSGGPGELNVAIEALQPSSGTSSGGGMFMSTPTATTGPDGEFRICDLAPGSYRMTVSERNGGTSFAIATVAISDKDLAELRLPTSPGLSLDADVVLEGPVPQTPITVKPTVSLQPLLRTQFPGEKSGGRPDIPGTVALSGLLMDDFSVRATVNAPGLYVRDVTYAGRSVMYEPLRLGSAIAGTGLQVFICQDGATFSAHVADKDGNPVADATVLAMPADTSSEGVLAARLAAGQTDQLGQYKSGTLAPGKYYVVATNDSYDMTPESIGKLWQSHARYQEVELTANGSAALSLQIAKIQ